MADVTVTISTSLDGNGGINVQSNDKSLIRHDSRLVIWILCIILIVIIISSYIYSKWININDFYRIGSLLTAFVHIVDAFSDALFGINIANQTNYPSEILSVLLAASIIFIILPAGITLYQLHRSINEWKINDDLSQWLSEMQQYYTLYL